MGYKDNSIKDNIERESKVYFIYVGNNSDRVRIIV